MSGHADTSEADLVTRANLALEQGAWAVARALFSEAVARSESGELLDGLAWAAWWAGDVDALLAGRERAYRAYRREGASRDAARVAAWLGTDIVDFRGDLAIAEGWYRRAHRLLDGAGACPELGWLFVHEAEKRLAYAGELRSARAQAMEAAELGREFADVDLEVLGLAMAGLAAVMLGDVETGRAQLSEAGTVALAEELAHRWAIFWCLCLVIAACELVRDHEGAAQWCRGLDAWSQRHGLEAFNRSCRMYHADVLIWQGDWRTAEHELVTAAERLQELRPPWAALCRLRLGELRRRQGRLDEAETLFQSVAGHELGILGSGELALDRDDPASARDRAEECLRATAPEASTPRASALDLLVRSLVRLGDVDEAARALAALRDVVATAPTDALQGAVAYSSALLAAAVGAHDAARRAFEDALRCYGRCGAPFEQARVRVALARTLASLERRADALSHARAAATMLEELGAAREAQMAAALAGELVTTGSTSPLTAREREVLRLVAAGGTNKVIAQQLVLSEHTVNRHITNILMKLGVGTRSSAVAEAIRHGLL